jgi:hypothetical protein
MYTGTLTIQTVTNLLTGMLGIVGWKNKADTKIDSLYLCGRCGQMDAYEESAVHTTNVPSKFGVSPV